MTLPRIGNPTNDLGRSTTARPAEPLAIYLNDHLTGATSGVELARRIAAVYRSDPAHGSTAQRIADEVAGDRAALLAIMRQLGVPVAPTKVVLGWLGEKAGRFKLNGHLLTRSPLSSVLELEAMRLGVEGKAAAWRTMRAMAEHDARLDTAALDELITRATEQVDTLERLRVAVATDVLT